MTDATTAIIRRHVEAITHMLIGDRPLEPGLAITAGQTLQPHGVAELARVAVLSNMDFIHLDFSVDGQCATLNGILVVAPRDQRCFVYTNCRLSQTPGARHAVILPADDARGHFKILPGEIVHMPHKPHELLYEGLRFADDRLQALVREGVKVDGQIDVFEVPHAA